MPSALDKLYYDSFPAGFQWGVATASYQIEGGVEYRGRNIWDTFSRIPGQIEDGSNGDVACDSYHLFETDIDNVAQLGMNFYRFSISWSRLIPSGVISEGVNDNGIDYYSRLLDKLGSAFEKSRPLQRALYSGQFFWNEQLYR